MKQTDEEPHGNNVRRPEQEKGLEHVKDSDEADNTPPDFGRPVDVVELVQPLLVLLPAESGNDRQKEGVHYDDHVDQNVAVVFGLVDGHREAVSLEEQGKGQGAQQDFDVARDRHVPSLQQEVGPLGTFPLAQHVLPVVYDVAALVVQSVRVLQILHPLQLLRVQLSLSFG